MRRIYLDHNATTPVRPEVFEAMAPFLRDFFGNPNSVHAPGQQARKAVEQARVSVASLLHSPSTQDIVFTSCGSEADVTAIAGAAREQRRRTPGSRNHIVTSAIEHDAVRLLVRDLSREGFEVTEVPVDNYGRVDAEAVGDAIRPSTAVVSIMHANNEVGTLQPVAEIATICKSRGVLFHTDAVQSVGKAPVDVRALGVDLLSLSGHKINAPKGIGALYVRRGVTLSPLITGHQEKNRRGGTENVASIVGLGKACELAQAEMATSIPKLEALRRRMEEGCKKISGSRINGHPTQRLPTTCHVSFEGLDGYSLVVALDLEGISASSGPACSSGAAESSHVLSAMGIAPEWASGSLRLSMGWGSCEEDIDTLLSVLPGAVTKLRKVQNRFSVAKK